MVKNSKVEKITHQVNMTFDKLTKKNIAPIRLEIELGRELNECKEVVKNSGNFWEEHAEKHFPHIHPKKRQRDMRLANMIDKEHHKSLHLLSATTLDKLCSICGSDGIETFLKKKKINLDFKRNSASLRIFQASVVQLILKQKPKESPSPKLAPPKQLGTWLAKLEKKSKAKSFRLKANNISLLKKYVSRLSTLIAVLEER